MESDTSDLTVLFSTIDLDENVHVEEGDGPYDIDGRGSERQGRACESASGDERNDFATLEGRLRSSSRRVCKG